jgi:hypothetical protein
VTVRVRFGCSLVDAAKSKRYLPSMTTDWLERDLKLTEAEEHQRYVALADPRWARALALHREARRRFCQIYSPRNFAVVKRHRLRTPFDWHAVSAPYRSYRQPWRRWYFRGTQLCGRFRPPLDGPPLNGGRHPGVYIWFREATCQIVGATWDRSFVVRLCDSKHPIKINWFQLGEQDSLVFLGCSGAPSSIVTRLESQVCLLFRPVMTGRCG